ncbi:hypothetical protein [Rhizobium halophytocola]|uniref:Uncharacterized protein n=1 Tax=Rhizobium halophytocola TaxID=735519 RepID=A0ABS4E386_9HYPH|nr:hypothetical protein [Rhizobium halophytocola]MBP1852406.1 hypothetical protein [Rhizobium halophytocola]
MIAKTFLLLTAGACLAAGAAHAAAATKSAEVPDIELLAGKCLSVQVSGEDMTSACTGVLGITEYVDGRQGFYFMMASKHVLTLSGLPKNKNQKRAKGFAIDRMIFNTGSETAAPKVISATGHCAYRAFGKKSVTVRCSGKLPDSSDFVAAFLTDSSEEKDKAADDSAD